jgi:hypothetical protein
MKVQWQVTQAVLLKSIDKGYKVEADWKIDKVEGKITLTPPKVPF